MAGLIPALNRQADIDSALLEIRNLQIGSGRGPKALRRGWCSLSVEPGKTFCLVGESGSGKSVTALSNARLLASPPAVYAGGEILLKGRNNLQMHSAELRQIRGGAVSCVFQKPGASLNPVFRISNQIKEALQLHRPEAATDAEVVRLLKLVGIPAPETRMKSYPHELSGGILVADEPTTAFDVTIRAQIIELLTELQQQLGMASFSSPITLASP
jgi:ABC-type dipeptide/oligopeptide/nickel transport system ATPase component